MQQKIKSMSTHLTLKEDANGVLGLHEATSQESLNEYVSDHDNEKTVNDEANNRDNSSQEQRDPLIDRGQPTTGEDASVGESLNENANCELRSKTNKEKQSSEAKDASEDQNKESKETQNARQLQDIATTLKSIQTSIKRMDNALFDPKNGVEVLLAKTITRVDDIYTEVHGAVSGIKVRLDKVENSTASTEAKVQAMEASLARLTLLLNENKNIALQLATMQGIIQKFSQQGQATSAKINDLTKRGMEQNLIIHGINEAETNTKEIPKQAVVSFLNEMMELQVDPSDIWKAHRLGYRRDQYVHPMVVKLAYHVKEQVMERLGMLKGKTNEVTQKPLFISEQVPEAISEAKRQIASKLKPVNEENEKLPPKQKKKIQIQHDKVLVDGILLENEITTPEPSELFLSIEEQKKVNAVGQQLVMTEPVTIKNSEFIALALQVQSLEKVKLAYKAAMQRFPSMDHVMMAYALKEEGKIKIGHCDDNEHGGGSIVRKTMALEKARDTAVFVVCKFGGLHLGVDRYKTIESISQTALDLLKQKLNG